MEATLSDYLESQDELLREAALALPHQFSQCTYPLGPLRYVFRAKHICPLNLPKASRVSLFDMPRTTWDVLCLFNRMPYEPRTGRTVSRYPFSKKSASNINQPLLTRFPKRNFRCDCPTTAIAHQCTLHAKLEEENTSNTYGQNFQGVFCRCGRPYDAKTERETMIQCLVCEVRLGGRIFVLSRANGANMGNLSRIGFMSHVVTSVNVQTQERQALF